MARRTLRALALGLLAAQGAAAQQPEPANQPEPAQAPEPASQPQPAEEPAAEHDKPERTSVEYGPRGLVVASGDGNYEIRLRFRLQLRASHPFDDDPVTPDDFAAPDRTSLDVRRARFKADGHVFRPWLAYELEYDLAGGRLYDLRMTLGRLPWLTLLVGQGKADYNREQSDSSSEQQFAERSIVDDVFTLDRQVGLELTGRFLDETWLDSRYYLGAFTGTGIGERGNDDSHLLWTARYQWNFLGRELEFTQSDVQGREKPVASLAGAFATNRSPYTAFSGSGGGQLEGFEPGGPGRYSLRQWLEEAALHYRGFSFQHEYHWKRVRDHETAIDTSLRGSYVQAGFFVYRPERGKPRGLEAAARWAFVDPDTSRARDRRKELTGVVNWFFRGHANKLTLDVSRLSLEQPAAETLVSHRVRLQWDVHF
jgi:hypothetical protein